MTRVAHLDPIGGLAGDMVLAALLDAGAPVAALEETVAALGLDVRIDVGRVQRSGIAATHVNVVTTERSSGRPAGELRAILTDAPLPDEVRAAALAAFDRLAAAEASIHGVSARDVVLHELGGDDTLVDLCGVFALLRALGVQRLTCGPLPMGGGLTTTQHGPTPLPAPATLAILAGLPIVGVETAGELVTPTGAAIAAECERGRSDARDDARGGRLRGRHARASPIGPTSCGWCSAQSARTGAPGSGEVVELRANVDDLLPELVPDVLEACLRAGALDAWVEPIQMKKGRPGLLLSVLARPADEARLADTLLRHSSTLGVRVQRQTRYELDRAIREVQVDGRTIRVKIGLLAGAVVNVAPEHDDCVAVADATGRPVKQIWAEAMAAATLDARRRPMSRAR